MSTYLLAAGQLFDSTLAPWFKEMCKGTGLPKIVYSARSEDNKLKLLTS